MIEFAAFVDYAPTAALAVMMVTAGMFCELRHRRARHRFKRVVGAQAERMATLERDLAALLSCSRGMAERLATSEDQQRRLQTQLDKLHSADDQQLAVQHAMKLLNSGVDLKNVTDLCELSEGEVEILQNLARHRQAA